MVLPNPFESGASSLRWSAAAPTPAGVTADPDHLERYSAGGGRDFLALIAISLGFYTQIDGLDSQITASL
jgi:hypothetical protein